MHESGTASDSISEIVTPLNPLSKAITEAGAAADAPHLLPLPIAVTETLHATDHETIYKAGQPSAISEAGSASDSRSQTTTGLKRSVSEHLNATDAVSQAGTAGSSFAIAERLHARDAFSTAAGPTQGGVYFWGYDYVPAGTNLCVWCAGLDCGTWPVAANGSVFVPWFSDPDGLFTAAYLLNLSNNPPPGGFGPSACNIDITIGGVLTRVVVDLSIGYCYQSQLQMLRPAVAQDTRTPTGPAFGEIQRKHQFAALLVNSGPPQVGGDTTHTIQVAYKTPGNSPYLLSTPFSGVWWDTLDDSYGFDGQMVVQISRPYPLVVSSLSGFLQVAERNGP